MSEGFIGMVPQEKKHGRKNLPPLPCGCLAGTGRGHTDATLLADGTRVCKKHGRQWALMWWEINPRIMDADGKTLEGNVSS